ncbi:uncharacterized protein LOC143898625 isoform X2 [Temnothorax americanus]|uniref:uncharacterized protein LOC143898625 isoform X2 n=1 Tax=Temnothorax americanus TaxID=1964332 RepID=UPI0040678CB7
MLFSCRQIAGNTYISNVACEANIRFYGKMKFSCVIFICPLVIASVMAMVQFSRTTFTSCEPDEWVMTNTTLEWSNNTKMIMCNITYKEADNRIIYRIHIMIGGCKNLTACTEEPTIWVEDINCNAQNLTESDMDACIIANFQPISLRAKIYKGTSIEDGHYTSMCREKTFWIEFDDGKIIENKRWPTGAKGLYILFLEKVGKK